MAKSLYEYCVEKKNDALLSQWHPEKNGDLRPEDVARGSDKKVWWLCEKGHAWEARVFARTNRGTGCPVCAKDRFKKTDLATSEPEIAKDWHPTKNGDLRPSDVARASTKKVWWVCENGHEWESSVCSRTTMRSGCPFCSGHRIIPGETDLASIHPEIAKQWHPTKNGDLLPSDVARFSNKKVWWRGVCGHEWEAEIKSRTRNGAGCPICKERVSFAGENNLVSAHPEIAKQWHPEKNGDLRPQDVMRGSRRKVWWVCEKGHEWEATVTARTSGGTGCPACTGCRAIPGETDLATIHPEIAKQWHPTKNGELQPTDVTKGSHRKVWWVCEKGHEWESEVFLRTTRGTGCPYCARERRRK